jgi:hypothetical protein
MSIEQVDEQADEMAVVLRWRRREALEAGLTLGDASRYAESKITTSELRHLVALHCPKELLAKILGCDIPVRAD